ncbi:MAG: long-chain fatty acid--CoA ligase [Candidatus Goldiibacteriota bacterium HGW-Goldbacteria-1]|jgi:long-chain acyl-CoA synthetase|nr:MAG: long-chain fatty acid--CoA ligase [Candidatus Goldiibacteriota bacterium HGW-Goldbacteria-1]
MAETLSELYRQSFEQNAALPAFSDYGKEPITYAQAAEKVAKMHESFSEAGLKKGDKIALAARNSTNWVLTYLSAITYGAVIVPILADFKPSEIQHIINHSDSVLLFASEEILEQLELTETEKLAAAYRIDTMEREYLNKKAALFMRAVSAVKNIFARKKPEKEPAHFFMRDIADSETAAIVYTSGTTGLSKGVVLSRRSLYINVRFAMENMPLKPGDNVLSFLPLAHSFGCAFEFLFPTAAGCHITYLDRLPSPTVLVEAFAKIKPRLILSVPLVLEKIYRNQIKKSIDGTPTGFLLNVPVVGKGIEAVIRKKIVNVFGGNFMEIVIGGASLSPEVDDFFKSIKFPFTIGYGMTECGPLVSYANWKDHKKGSVGKLINYLQARIDSPDPAKVPGEILLKGESVMKEYYKNPTATRDTIVDGWLKTGDLGTMDSEGNIALCGRSKNMILGPSGQNIYPEEIETKLSVMRYVSECVVVDRGGKITALVFPDMDGADKDGLDEAGLEKEIENIRKKLNTQLPAYSQVSAIKIHAQEFEKTPSKKIKRFLYS